MSNFRSCWFFVMCLLGASAYASDAAQTCNDMYPADSYEAEERSALIQDCMSAYGGDTEGSSYETSSDSGDPAYYEGTVEDYVNEVPTEEPVPVEEPITYQ